MIWMPFGKYKGRPLNEVPMDYLRWLVRECSGLHSTLRQAVRQEIARRRGKSPSKRPRRAPRPTRAPMWDYQLLLTQAAAPQ
jgi:hypothetical protein